ncbi:MAG TPA: PQQ-binding-like beta-propeller repeat protein, partial [Terriglobia bacterium]|nr:PQQ-binding-like beta-propeller repeat protein [Terriglobia bacterium]
MSKRFLFGGTLLIVAVIAVPSAIRAGEPGTGSWPMWGGTPDRNMVSNMKGLPGEWDIKTGKNVKWVAKLGSQSYGNPVVADGIVFVGTNNELLRDPNQGGDRGVLMAFRESDGEFLWQHTHAKLESGRANDWPFQGVASSPLVVNDRLYYVSNRGVVFCLDTQGFRDGENDGAVKDEKLTRPVDADVVWSFDMMEQVGSYPHNLSNSSPVLWNDRLFVSTSNGQDESHVNVPSPKAPSIIALGKDNGDLLWEDNSVQDRILHGQWSTPSVGTIGGVVQVISAQGDGWVRGYEAATGKKLWEFDTNPKNSVWPRTRNEVIATPVVYRDRVYIANGQDPEHGEGVGHFYAIDGTKRGDITQSGVVWHYEKIRRSISTAAIADDLVYIADFSGFLH